MTSRSDKRVTMGYPPNRTLRACRPSRRFLARALLAEIEFAPSRKAHPTRGWFLAPSAIGSQRRSSQRPLSYGAKMAPRLQDFSRVPLLPGQTLDDPILFPRRWGGR